MSLLVLIWLVSLVLSLAALLVMIGLILARFLRSRRDRLRAAQRREIVQHLLGTQGDLPAALGQMPADHVVGTYLDLIRMVRGDERQLFVEQAHQLGVPARLADDLKSASARKRLLAAQALGEFRNPVIRGRLEEALNDRNQDVRLAAALSLAEENERLDLRAMVEKLKLGAEEDSVLAVTLFRKVAETRPDQIKALVLDPNSNGRARLAAIEALAATGDYSLVPFITNLALDASDDDEALPRYIRVLGALGHPAGAPAILDGMNRTTTGPRAAAAGAAGKIGLEQALAPLGALLDDAEWWVRYRAAEALVRLGEPGLVRLRSAAASGTPRAQEAASSMLAETQSGS